MKLLLLHQKFKAITMTCNARLKWYRLLFDEDRPRGIFAQIPGYGIGKGKVGDDEATQLRGKCKVLERKEANGERVRSTDTAKNEHHLAKHMVSTAGLL